MGSVPFFPFALSEGTDHGRRLPDNERRLFNAFAAPFVRSLSKGLRSTVPALRHRVPIATRWNRGSGRTGRIPTWRPSRRTWPRPGEQASAGLLRRPGRCVHPRGTSPTTSFAIRSKTLSRPPSVRRYCGPGMTDRDPATAPFAMAVEFRSASSFLIAYSVNLSRGGLFLETGHELPVGAPLDQIGRASCRERVLASV